MAYWPAWIVAPALAALTVGYWIVLRRPLGVAAVLAAEQAALEAAMAQMTAEAFGPPLAATGSDDATPVAAPGATEWPATAPAAEASTAEGRVCAPTPRLSVHA